MKMLNSHYRKKGVNKYEIIHRLLLKKNRVKRFE